MDIVKRIFFQNEKREELSGKVGWIKWMLMSLSFMVNPGLLSLFSYRMYRNGGIVFLIPYYLAHIVIGIPLMILEMSLGQFTSSGAISCWNFAPITVGLGVAMVVHSLISASVVNTVAAHYIYYFFASLTTSLPWKNCGDWATNLCRDNVKIFDPSTESCSNNRWNITFYSEYGRSDICYRTPFSNGISDIAAVSTYSTHMVVNPAREYFERHVTGSVFSTGIDDIGAVRWRLCLCSLAGVAIIFIILIKGIKSFALVILGTTALITIIMVTFFAKAMTLEGGSEALPYLLVPDVKKLKTVKTWIKATTLAVYSCSIGVGGWITLSSFKRFKGDFVRDAILLCFIKGIVEIITSVVLFRFLGFLAFKLQVDIPSITGAGYYFFNIEFAKIFVNLPNGNIWSALFYFMLILLWIGSMCLYVEIVVTAIMDVMKKLRKFTMIVRAIICALVFVLCIPMSTNGGRYLIYIFDTGYWILFPILVFECYSLGYFYGAIRLVKDIEIMIGTRCFFCFPWEVIKYIFVLLWCIVTPVALKIMYGFLCAVFAPSLAVGNTTERTLTIVIWTMIGLVIPLCAVINFFRTPGGVKEKLLALVSPTREFGPKEISDRMAVRHQRERYKPDFVINPWVYEVVEDTDEMTDLEYNPVTTTL